MSEDNAKPVVEKFEAEDDGPDGGLAWFVGAAVAAAVAVLCFTPVWDMVAPTELRERGRRAGFSNLIYNLGPTGVAAVAGVVAVLMFLVALSELRKARRADRATTGGE